MQFQSVSVVEKKPEKSGFCGEGVMRRASPARGIWLMTVAFRERAPKGKPNGHPGRGGESLYLGKGLFR